MIPTVSGGGLSYAVSLDSPINEKGGSRQPPPLYSLIARTGLEPVLSALRGRRVNQLHQRAR
jgi:hypothetical protein